MKVTELMIGNFVMLGNKIIRVDAIHKRKIGYHIRFDKMNFVFEDRINPIPLTPEILEKNGIVYDYDETECVADYKYVNIKGYKFYDENNNVLIDYCNGHIKFINDITNIVVNMDINYVHELQNAMTLCGIYKKFEL